MEAAPSLLIRLAQLQGMPPYHGATALHEGLLPARRHHPHLPYQRPDENVFCTATVLFILQGLLPLLNTAGQHTVNTMLEKGRQAYRAFRNKDGHPSYNFWPTAPSRHFNHGLLMHRLPHFQIPDDIDDTALVHLTLEHLPMEKQWLKAQKLPAYANGVIKWMKPRLPQYGQLQAYGTFFVRDMDVEFDACVLSNLLCWIMDEGFALNQHDHDSLEVLRRMLELNHHMSNPFAMAPHYGRPALILYHVCRLLHRHNPAPLAPFKATLARQALQGLEIAKGMERILLGQCLVWLRHPHSLAVTGQQALASTSRWAFFHAGMLTAYDHPGLRRMAHRSFWHLRYTSEAINLALALQYELTYKHMKAF